MILAAVGVAVLVPVMVLKCEHTAMCACEKCYSEDTRGPNQNFYSQPENGIFGEVAFAFETTDYECECCDL